MDIRQLRYFIAIVEQGSFSKASSLLNVAQPALSLHVGNMEADLGTTLLFRKSNGVVPTESGQILLRNARLIIDQFEKTRAEIIGHEAEPSGEVRLGLPSTMSQLLSVPVIVAARKKFPKVTLRIAEALSGFVLDWAREGRVDLAVIYVPVADRALSADPILTEDLCLFGPVTPLDGVTLEGREIVTFAKISQLPLILPSPIHGLRVLLEAKATEHGLSLSTVTDVDSYGSIKELVDRGLGYSILPYSAIAREVEANRLRAWEITQPELKRSVYLVHQAVRPMTNAVAAIEQLARETLVELVTTGRWSGARALGVGQSS